MTSTVPCSASGRPSSSVCVLLTLEFCSCRRQESRHTIGKVAKIRAQPSQANLAQILCPSACQDPLASAPPKYPGPHLSHNQQHSPLPLHGTMSTPSEEPMMCLTASQRVFDIEELRGLIFDCLEPRINPAHATTIPTHRSHMVQSLHPQRVRMPGAPVRLQFRASEAHHRPARHARKPSPSCRDGRLRQNRHLAAIPLLQAGTGCLCQDDVLVLHHHGSCPFGIPRLSASPGRWLQHHLITSRVSGLRL